MKKAIIAMTMAVCCFSACTQKAEDVTLQVKTQCGVLLGFEEDGVKKLYTFLDGDGFLENWGFGKDNCGNETHIAPKGVIHKSGNVVTTEKQPFMLDLVGRYTVEINGKE